MGAKSQLSGSLISTTKLIFSFVMLGLFSVLTVAQAQTVTILGGLGNFDVINNTGQDAHGLEVEIDGIQPKDVYYQRFYIECSGTKSGRRAGLQPA